MQHYVQGLIQAVDSTMSGISQVVENADEQRIQHFISNSPWDHEPLVEHIAQEVNALLGGKPGSALVIDESSFEKKGTASVGVARQWLGRQGKADNRQVAVFSALTDGTYASFVGSQLYLPMEWTDHPQRCEQAGIPPEHRTFRTKAAMALELTRQALDLGLKFDYVLADGGYGKEPQFLRDLDEMHVKFVVDVHSNQTVWMSMPEVPLAGPAADGTDRKRRSQTAAQAKASPPNTVAALADSLRPEQWQRFHLRDGTRGPIEADIACLTVWVWDGFEVAPKQWTLVIRREVEDITRPKTARNNRKKQKGRKARKAKRNDRKAVANSVAMVQTHTAEALAAGPDEAAAPPSEANAAPAGHADEQPEDTKTKYSLSNAPLDTPALELARQQGLRYNIERCNQDGKSSCGMADYRCVGWRAWHHHTALVMAAMLFVLQQRLQGLDVGQVLSFEDVVFMVAHRLVKPKLSDEEIERMIAIRYKRRLASTQSNIRRKQKALGLGFPAPS